MIGRTGGDLLQWLRGFHNVVVYGNLTRAARHMAINQSAVSRQIRNLEKEYGVTLFLRENNRLSLTEEGALLYEKTKALFDLLNETRDRLSPPRDRSRGNIALSVPHVVAQNFMPGVIADFHRENPESTFTLRAGSSPQIFEDVVKGLVHFGIVNQYRDLDQYRRDVAVTPLFGARLQLIAPPGNPFGLSEECSLRDVADLPFVAFAPDYAVGLIVRDYIRQRGIRLRTVLTASSFNVLIEQVAAGLGVAIVDTFAIRPDTPCERINIIDEFPLRKYLLITRVGRYIPPQTNAFQRFMRERMPPPRCMVLREEEY